MFNKCLMTTSLQACKDDTEKRCKVSIKKHFFSEMSKTARVTDCVQPRVPDHGGPGLSRRIQERVYHSLYWAVWDYIQRKGQTIPNLKEIKYIYHMLF